MSNVKVKVTVQKYVYFKWLVVNKAHMKKLKPYAKGYKRCGHEQYNRCQGQRQNIVYISMYGKILSKEIHLHVRNMIAMCLSV